MEKVVLVTLQGNTNYGNRLQNYALQHVISSFGFSVDNLIVNLDVLGRGDRNNKLLKWRFWTILGRSGFAERYAKLRREDGCIRFSDKYTPRIFIPREKLEEMDWSGYAFGVTGSDQVWHNWAGLKIPNQLSMFYLEFLSPEKRISYAPSFGFSSFPEEDLVDHRKGLLGINALSCRELEGCELIQKLTGKRATKVLDPVLLLQPTDWECIEKKPPFSVKKPYLLRFFLGSVPPEYCSEIERIRLERDLTVLDINDPSDPKHYGLSPAHFIWLIHHADTVCTDSFHATAFSVIYGVNLRVFPRVQSRASDMFGRIRDLLSPLGLMELTYQDRAGSKLSTNLSSEALAYMTAERKRSLQYLQDSLHV